MMHIENPFITLKAYDRTDWHNIGARVLLMVGVGALGAALGIQLAATGALASLCSGVVTAGSGCADYTAEMNSVMRQTAGAGIAACLAGSLWAILVEESQEVTNG